MATESISEIRLKRCPTCGIEKPATNEFFSKSRSRKDGLCAYCKGCDSARSCAYHFAHREKRLAYNAVYRAAHMEEHRNHNASHRASHPEEYRAYDRARRAREHGAVGTHTIKDVRLQLKAQTDKKGRLRCHWCGRVIKGDYHVDHIMPLARGGSNAPENLVITCPKCNLSKGTKTPAEWNGRLL